MSKRFREGFIGIDSEMLEEFKLYFISISIGYEGSLRKLCHYFDKSTSLPLGCGIAKLKHLLITKKVDVDILIILILISI